MSHAYEKNALNIVMKVINAFDKQNGYLTFEALKYLAALLCHKKFATEFIALQGLQVFSSFYVVILSFFVDKLVFTNNFIYY